LGLHCRHGLPSGTKVHRCRPVLFAVGSRHLCHTYSSAFSFHGSCTFLYTISAFRTRTLDGHRLRCRDSSCLPHCATLVGTLPVCLRHTGHHGLRWFTHAFLTPPFTRFSLLPAYGLQHAHTTHLVLPHFTCTVLLWFSVPVRTPHTAFWFAVWTFFFFFFTPLFSLVYLPTTVSGRGFTLPPCHTGFSPLPHNAAPRFGTTATPPRAFHYRTVSRRTRAAARAGSTNALPFLAARFAAVCCCLPRICTHTVYLYRSPRTFRSGRVLAFYTRIAHLSVAGLRVQVHRFASLNT